MPYGISRTTLNKVYGKDFITKYSVQLAGRYEHNKTEINEEFALTLKLDGNRCTVFNYEDDIKFFARSGKEFEGLIELEEDFKYLPKGFVYDGELISKNLNNLPSKDLFRLTQTISRKKGIKENLDFIIFDIIPISEFEKGKSKLNYKERLEQMNKIFEESLDKLKSVKQVPLFYIGKDLTQIPKLLDQVTSEGFEGLMLNTLNGHYQTKRTKDLLKIKEFHTIDVRVIGVEEDIRGGRCGSLTIDYKGYRVNVAGLNDKLKEEFWNNPTNIIGKIIEVKYFEESSNANGGLSLRFPSFISVRTDKNEVSYN